MDNTENLLNNDLQIDTIAHTHLKETAMWAKFVSVVGIVISILLAIMAFFVGAMFSKYSTSPYSRYGSEGAMMGAGMITGIYLILAVVCFFMSLYLNRFAVKMKTALLNFDQLTLNLSFQNLKVYFRIIGIITALYLAILAIAFLVAIGAALMR